MSWGWISRLPTTRRAFPRTGSKTAPEYFSFWMIVWRWTGWMSVRRMSPPVRAPATRKVPASIRSGMISWLAPPSSLTPWTRIVSSPMPSIRAPILTRSSQRLVISGSRAQLSEDGLALGQGGGHDQVLGPRHRLFLELDRRAGELVGRGLDVAVLEVDGRAELLEPVDVKVDGPRADGTAAGQGDDGLPVAGQERAQDEDGGPHRPDQLVGRFVRGDAPDVDVEGVPLDLVFGPELFHQGQDGEDVLDQGDVRQVEVLAGEQAGRDRREDGVLRAADPDLSLEPQVVLPPDADAFHGINSKGSARKKARRTSSHFVSRAEGLRPAGRPPSVALSATGAYGRHPSRASGMRTRARSAFDKAWAVAVPPRYCRIAREKKCSQTTRTRFSSAPGRGRR